MGPVFGTMKAQQTVRERKGKKFSMPNAIRRGQHYLLPLNNNRVALILTTQHMLVDLTTHEDIHATHNSS